MYANSWLYHYYSVQSKIQFGIPYEGPARVQSSTTPYIHHHSHHMYHTNHHHHSPTALEASLAHSYVSSHHLSTYGYHSPVSQHQASPGLVNHYNPGTPQLNYHSANEYYRPYAYRIESHPVDFSGTINIDAENSIGSNGSSSVNTNQQQQQIQQQQIGSPPMKRRAVTRLEPLYIPDQQHETSSDTSIDDTNYHRNNNVTSDGGTALLTVTVPTIRQNQIHIKAITETIDFMDQWNPSPPWSETTQKVPDIVQQELSPYMTRTPPTPTSAPPPVSATNNGHTFSFDWMPEQFVPIIDNTNGNLAGTNIINDNVEHQTATSINIQVPLQIAAVSNWAMPVDYKVLNSIERDSANGE